MKKTMRLSFFSPSKFKRTLLGFISLLFFILFYSSTSFAQNPAEWNFKIIQKDSISVGDTITFELGRNFPSGYSWNIETDSTTFERFEPLNPETTEVENKDGNQYKIRQGFIWWGYRNDTLKPMTFSLKNGTDSTYFTTQPVYIYPKLFSAATDTSLRPEKEIEITVRPWWHYVLWATLILAAGFLIYYFYQQYQKKKTDVPDTQIVEIEKTPYEIFTEEMNELQKSQSVWQNDVKNYYSGLTEILKRYLELKFKYHVLEMTTDELLDWVKKEPIVYRSIPNLNDILNRADLIKFAKQDAVLPQMVSDYDEVKLSVEKIERDRVFISEINSNTEPNPQGKGESNVAV